MIPFVLISFVLDLLSTLCYSSKTSKLLARLAKVGRIGLESYMKQFLTFVMLVSAACGIVASRPALGQDHADRYWKVDDVRVGMKGVGKTVMEGRKIEEFRVEVIGILKKVFPNQDIFLAELSGLASSKRASSRE